MMPGVMIYHGRLSNELAYHLGYKCPADESEGRRISARGGVTLIIDFDAAVGGAARCTMRDNYSKKIGVSIATGRINRAYRGIVTERDELLVCQGIAVVVPRIRNYRREEVIYLIEEAVRKMSYQHECQLGWAREHGVGGGHA